MKQESVGLVLLILSVYNVSASVKKCGYPTNSCLCDVQYGSIFCGHDVNEFPVFPSYIIQYTSEIHLVQTRMFKLPDLNSKVWPKIKKLILRNNTNLNCHDVFDMKDINQDIMIISDCKITPSQNKDNEVISTSMINVISPTNDEKEMGYEEISTFMITDNEEISTSMISVISDLNDGTETVPNILQTTPNLILHRTKNIFYTESESTITPTMFISEQHSIVQSTTEIAKGDDDEDGDMLYENEKNNTEVKSGKEVLYVTQKYASDNTSNNIMYNSGFEHSHHFIAIGLGICALLFVVTGIVCYFWRKIVKKSKRRNPKRKIYQQRSKPEMICMDDLMTKDENEHVL